MRARKRFGQHFLQAVWAARLVEAAAFDASDAVVEIGPGQGVLTRALLTRHPAVTAVEIDRDLVAELREALPGSVQLVQDDVLQTDWAALSASACRWHAAQVGAAPDRLRLVGNLPYNIASPLLVRLLHASREGHAGYDATVMLQREVAERILASPDTPDYGPLAVVMQTWADVRRVLDVPPGAFRPIPKVHSTVIRLTWRAADINAGDPLVFEQVVRRVFQQRRKQLSNAMSALADERGVDVSAWLDAAALDGARRPGTLTRPELARLTAALGPAATRNSSD